MFRSAATAALVALGLWLFLTMLWPMLLTGRSADAVRPAGDIARRVLDTRQAFARLVARRAVRRDRRGRCSIRRSRSTQQSMLAALGLALIEPGAVPGAPTAVVAKHADRVAADRRH